MKILLIQGPSQPGTPASRTGTPATSKPSSLHAAIRSPNSQGSAQGNESPHTRTPAKGVGSPEQGIRLGGEQLGPPTIQVQGPTPVRTPAR